jgi:hypothetical protein
MRDERDFPCTAGNNMLFLSDQRGGIAYPIATYYGARLTLTEGLQPDGGKHQLYSCETIRSEGSQTAMVAAYAVKRHSVQHPAAEYRA